MYKKLLSDSKTSKSEYPNYGYDFPLKKPSDGYFYAKREAADGIMRRVAALEKEADSLPQTSENVDKHRCLKSKIQALEEIRSFMRNAMLWDTRRGK